MTAGPGNNLPPLDYRGALPEPPRDGVPTAFREPQFTPAQVRLSRLFWRFARTVGLLFGLFLVALVAYLVYRSLRPR